MQAFFFDMDGIIFNSMPHHAEAWEEMMHRHGYDFSAYDTYLQEGRTGESVITEYFLRKYGEVPDADYIERLYAEKTALFEAKGEVEPIEGVLDVLTFLQQRGKNIWIVTGSGQESLFDRLDHYFPSIFSRDRMITAFDVKKCKPDPEPYLVAWRRSGVPLSEGCVIENAPLGIQAGKAAGLFTIGINTGILHREDLEKAGADLVFDNMAQLLAYLEQGIGNKE